MADAFSLAVNIFTLLEFGRKLVILALEIRKDGKDAISRISSLDLTSQELSKIAGELGQSRHSTAAQIQDSADERIHKLAERCTEVALQLQGTIRRLGMDEVNRKTSRGLARAFKFKWKESDIMDFQSEIQDLRSQLMLNLVFWLRFVPHVLQNLRASQSLVLMNQIRTGMMKSLDNQDSMIQKFSEVRSHDEGLKERLDHLADKHEGFVQQITEILSSTATSVIRFSGYNQPQASQLEMDLMNAMQSSPKEIGYEDISGLKMSPSRLARVQHQFIDMFRYNTMFDREDGVVEAHQGTLKWIFNNSTDETRAWNDLGQWLESEDPLYWITGKMGSGKSTLMKYISEELPIPGKFLKSSEAGKKRRCTPYLLRWAQGQPLFIAMFYFWAGSNEETRIQTSVEGLYRTLITQILEVYPEAAPHISPRRWENVCLFNRDSKPPRITELKGILTKAIQYVISTAKVCLFIDGLDEFEGDSDELEGLITWVKTLVETSPAKVCVSSRPWRVFEDALQDRPHLLMEDFNFKDIQQYVLSRFHDDPNFTAKKQIETDLCDELLHEIVFKAQGVFLWVNLVCISLLAAMSAGDLVGRLKRILKELPAEMEKLYDHILDNLEPAYKDYAAQYFSLMRLEPNALIFSFADDFGEDREFAINMAKKSLTDAESQYRMTELRKRINSRCRGLISLAPKATAEWDTENVHYCHRSVKDYITLGTVQEKLTGMFNAPFDPHLTLCSAYLARWKYCERDCFHYERLRIILCCVKHASKVVGESFIMIRLLDTLDAELGGKLPLSFRSEKNSHFHVAKTDVRAHFGRDPWFGGTLLSLAVALGAIEYVKSKVGREPNCLVKTSFPTTTPTQDFRPYLNIGLTGRSERSLMREKDQHLSMIDQLQFKAWQTAQVEWPLLLDALLAAALPNPAMVNLLLENGADRRLMIRRAAWARSALNMVFYRLRTFPLLEDIWPSIQLDRTERKAWVDTLCVMLQHGAKPDRSDVEFLRKLLGEIVMEAQRLPHLGRHREIISKLLTIFDQTSIAGGSRLH